MLLHRILEAGLAAVGVLNVLSGLAVARAGGPGALRNIMRAVLCFVLLGGLVALEPEARRRSERHSKVSQSVSDQRGAGPS